MGRKVDLVSELLQRPVSAVDQRAFYAAHPPRALAGLQCAATSMPDIDFENQGEQVRSVFSIACGCGGRVFTVIGNLMKSVNADISLVGAESRAVAKSKDQREEAAKESGVGAGDCERGNDEVDDQICSPIVLECGALRFR